MKKICKYTIVVVLFIGLSSCFSNRYEFIGKKKMINTENLWVKFYQLDEFDMVTPISYQVVDINDSLLTRRYFLIGTNDKLKNVDSLLIFSDV